jgi:hypothetical protein
MPDSVPLHEPFTSAATRTALRIALMLTGDDDPRIPELLPQDPERFQTVIGELEQVAGDCAELAMTTQPGVPLRERAYALMLYTRTAVDIIDSTARWTAIANNDPRPLHVAAYVALLGVLTHQLISSGKPPSSLKDAAHTCTITVAVEIADEPGTQVDSATLRARMDAADAARNATKTD